MSNDYILCSERLGFRHWQTTDLPLAMALWGDYQVTRYFDSRGALSEEQVKERLLKEITTQETHDIQYWPCFDLETGDFIGCAGLRPYKSEMDILEIGFHIRSEHWRKGYAREAALAVIDYAFNQLKVKALFAGHNPNNSGSQILLGKLGFLYTHDEFYQPTGLEHPSYLLKADHEQHVN
ncbi:GNAT family N-acetyltransferase [Parendozoicomonas haliclonae]|uniref:Acetyltransferase (GNAT) family protein n=1 Tax=Parendozoicomonas haliclonae TaxID=1960125 RepID=A0A1X7AK79_9GAMM|nr:GNAT family N-acetyltransferase [Parendozoicomonas haliclonae]SMA47607.1 Acetyltransferase (GNAT) family protein [Parendozoicomonas haliclonae]